MVSVCLAAFWFSRRPTLVQDARLKLACKHTYCTIHTYFTTRISVNAPVDIDGGSLAADVINPSPLCPIGTPGDAAEALEVAAAGIELSDAFCPWVVPEIETRHL